MKLAPWLAAGFVVIAITESVLGLSGPRSIATSADWEAAAADVRGRFSDGDLIVFAPSWVDQVGRMHLGDRIPIAMAARADADRYARIWELSIHGVHAEEGKGLPVAYERAFGRVSVRRYDKPAVTVLRDLTADFAQARVTSTPSAAKDAAEQPCLADGVARRCGPTRVEPRVLEIDYRPRRGVLVPLQAGAITAVAYDDLPAGKLVGYVGLHDYYARKSADGTVTFRVRVDGSRTTSLPIHNPAVGEDGWRRFEIELGDEGRHTVRFEIESAQPAWRNLGFHAEVRAP